MTSMLEEQWFWSRMRAQTLPSTEAFSTFCVCRYITHAACLNVSFWVFGPGGGAWESVHFCRSTRGCWGCWSSGHVLGAGLCLPLCWHLSLHTLNRFFLRTCSWISQLSLHWSLEHWLSGFLHVDMGLYRIQFSLSCSSPSFSDVLFESVQYINTLTIPALSGQLLLVLTRFISSSDSFTLINTILLFWKVM